MIKDSKIRIAYIIQNLSRIGGSEKNLMYLLNGLKDQTESIAFCLINTGKVAREIKNSNIPVINLHANNLSVLSLYKTILILARKLREERIEIVYAYSFGPSLIGGIAALLVGVPYISARRQVTKWRKIRHHIGFVFINAMAKILTVNSKAVYSITAKECFTKNKIRLIHNGVDIPENNKTFSNKSLPSNPCGYKIVGCIANYRPVKNIDLLINAAPDILSVHENTIFWIIGDGTERPKIYDIINKLDLVDRVFLTGSRTDISFLLSHINVFVLPSLAEGFPNSILEAMAHGLPVVSTDVGGIPDAVINGNTGFLVPSGDVRALSKKIIYLLSNENEAIIMGKRGKRRVRKHFSIERMLQKQFALYTDILNR